MDNQAQYSEVCTSTLDYHVLPELTLKDKTPQGMDNALRQGTKGF